MTSRLAAAQIPTTSPRSLEGVRVLDLSRALVGPWCTQTPANLRAAVFKFERPGRRDDNRGWGPPLLPQTEDSVSTEAACYPGANRNKRSVTSDLSHPGGQALIRQFVVHCHVLVENFKVDDMGPLRARLCVAGNHQPCAGVLLVLGHRFWGYRTISRSRRL